MKNEQQQQAKHLYFQSALNKSQIADLLGVNRRTVMLWVQQGNWDRLKMSSMHMPSMVVEKCYYMLNHYLDNLMAANNTISTFGPKEAAAINQMATAIKKINNRSAVNESMELLSFFLDDVRKKDPAMAEAIMPFAEQYIAKRSKTNLADLLPKEFNDQGFINQTDDDIMEQWLDEQEYEKMAREAAEALAACHGDDVTVSSPNHEPPHHAGSSPNCEPGHTEPTRDIRAEYEAWKTKKVELEEVLREYAETFGKATGEPVVEPAIVSTPCENISSPSARKPYMPNPISDIFKQKETLPKSVEKQLTEYLKNQSKNKVAA